MMAKAPLEQRPQLVEAVKLLATAAGRKELARSMLETEPIDEAMMEEAPVEALEDVMTALQFAERLHSVIPLSGAIMQ